MARVLVRCLKDFFLWILSHWDGVMTRPPGGFWSSLFGIDTFRIRVHEAIIDSCVVEYLPASTNTVFTHETAVINTVVIVLWSRRARRSLVDPVLALLLLR